MGWQRTVLTALLVAVLVGAVIAGRGLFAPRRPAPAGPPPKVAELRVETVPEGLSHLSYTLKVEVADTPEKRRTGLAGRRGLPPGVGMLYVYEQPRRPEFSESQTPFPVSVAFIREDGTVAEVYQAAAYDPRVLQPAEPVKYVLEVRQGWFADRGLGPGTRLIVEPPEPSSTSQAAAATRPEPAPSAEGSSAGPNHREPAGTPPPRPSPPGPQG